MIDITIPPEALTAAELAYTEALSNGEDPIRAACLAMLKHWPWMTTDGRELHFSTAQGAPVTTVKAYSIILPLHKENTNGEG